MEWIFGKLGNFRKCQIIGYYTWATAVKTFVVMFDDVCDYIHEEIADYYDVQYETSTNDLFARMTKKL